MNRKDSGIAVTVRISGAEADIHVDADAATVETGAADLKVMLSDFTGAEKVYIACDYTNLRRGVDGLAALVQQELSWIRLPTHCFCSVADAGAE